MDANASSAEAVSRNDSAYRHQDVSFSLVLGGPLYQLLLRTRFTRPTLELVLTESPVHLRKKHDATSGLALIDLGAAIRS